MKIIIVFSILSFYVANTSFAQTGNKVIEQAIRDPKRVENAGKADALQINKTKISDSIVAPQTTCPVKKNCSTGRKKKS